MSSPKPASPPDAHPWLTQLLGELPPMVPYEDVAKLLRRASRSIGRMASRGTLQRVARGCVTRDSLADYLRSTLGRRAREELRLAGPRTRPMGVDRVAPEVLVERGLDRAVALLGILHRRFPDGFRASQVPGSDRAAPIILTHLAAWRGELKPQQIGVVLRDLRDVPLEGLVLRREDLGPWRVEKV